MAAENEGKTEDPTEKKKSKSREKGQVARSKELATFLQLLGAAIFFFLWGGYIADAMFKIMKNGLTFEQEDAFDPSRMFVRMQGLLDLIALPLFAFTVAMMVIGIVSSIIVGGFNFTMQAAKPKFNKLNPLSGLKRMFGVQGLVQLVQSLAKFVVVVIAAYVLLNVYFDKLMHINIEQIPSNIETALDILLWVFIWLAFSLIVVAAIDVP